MSCCGMLMWPEKAFALRARNGYKMCEGEHGPNTVRMKGIADDPSQRKRRKANEKGSILWTIFRGD